MIRAALEAALARGGDYADVFFQHRIGRTVALEDGKVNRAFASVSLGVGVRVVKGDQTGYGYTEEITTEALRNAAGTAAAIADGPSRAFPTAFRADPGKHPASPRATSSPAAGTTCSPKRRSACSVDLEKRTSRPTNACRR
jgi:predicted Zn-dependent protease